MHDNTYFDSTSSSESDSDDFTPVTTISISAKNITQKANTIIKSLKLRNLRNEVSSLMEIFFQDICQSLIKNVKLPVTFINKHSNFIEITTNRQKLMNYLFKKKELQSSQIQDDEPIFKDNNIMTEEKKSLRKDAQFMECSNQISMLVTSIMFKNKKVLYEMIDDFVGNEVMPLSLRGV